MIYKTFAEIKSKVERETDMEAEDFVQPQEFIDYTNDGIDEVESEIHKLGLEDEYFLKYSHIALTLGDEEYDLPTDIYSNKIRRIVYKSGNTNLYTITRLRGKQKFEDLENINQNGSIDYYKYLLINQTPTTLPQLLLVPAARETSATNVKIWYIRNANRWVADDTENCDLPEIAMNYLYAYIAWRIFSKDGTGKQSEAFARKEDLKKQMVETLTNMVPDEDSEMDKDMDLYLELS